eukprot:3562355-Pleurochrysis_carterae.AAC.1
MQWWTASHHLIQVALRCLRLYCCASVGGMTAAQCSRHKHHNTPPLHHLRRLKLLLDALASWRRSARAC